MADECALAVVGCGGVGKSALALRVCLDRFFTQEVQEPVIEGSYRKQLIVDGQVCFIDILDTPGRDEYPSLSEHYMRQREGFVLVYSITCRSSFEAISEYYNRIIRTRSTSEEGDQTPPMVIVGNKCDLDESRVVSTTEGAELAASLACSFVEASAKTPINVDDLFGELARQVMAVKVRERSLPKKRPCSCIKNRCIVC